MRWPLRRQILLPMVGIVVLTIGIVSALNAWLATSRIRRQMERQLADVTETLSAANFPLTDQVLRQTRGLTGAEFVATQLDGAPLAASDELLSPAAAARGPRASVLDLSQAVRVDRRSYFHAAAALDRRPVQGGQFILHVFYPESQWREARWQAAWPPLALGGAAVLLVVAAAYALSAHITQPLERLRSQVGEISAGRFAAVALPPRDDEIRELAAAINRLAQQLARYEQATRASERLRTLFTLGGGIAHQIRNAATGCRIALDLHQRDCPLADSNGHVEPLAVALRQLGLIETHIQRLLTLGRPPSVEKRAIDLTEVARQAIELVRPSALHLGVEPTFTPPAEPLIVDADGEALVQMLINLLVNAVEAAAKSRVSAPAASSPAGHSVSLRLQYAGNKCEIAVVDPGSGPALQMQPRLFEPFATNKPGGTGLGLAVVRQIAEDHGGAVRWERRGDETWFIVELPVHFVGNALCGVPPAGNALCRVPPVGNALCGVPAERT